MLRKRMKVESITGRTVTWINDGAEKSPKVPITKIVMEMATPAAAEYFDLGVSYDLVLQ